MRNFDINLKISKSKKLDLISRKLLKLNNIDQGMHFTRDWIPDYYLNKINVIGDDWCWTGERTDNKKVFYIEHGIGAIFCSSMLSDVYCCITKQGYEFAKSKGANAYYTGSAYNDYTMPRRRNEKLLIYTPPHCFPIDVIGKGLNYKPYRKDELWNIAKDYGCTDFVTSCTEDTPIQYYDNIVVSDRNDALSHFGKCRWLYENAKVIFTDWTATFDIVGENLGIKTIRVNDKTELPKHDKWETLVDGKCIDRIEELLIENIKE